MSFFSEKNIISILVLSVTTGPCWGNQLDSCIKCLFTIEEVGHLYLWSLHFNFYNCGPNTWLESLIRGWMLERLGQALAHFYSELSTQRNKSSWDLLLITYQRLQNSSCAWTCVILDQTYEAQGSINCSHKATQSYGMYQEAKFEAGICGSSCWSWREGAPKSTFVGQV